MPPYIATSIHEINTLGELAHCLPDRLAPYHAPVRTMNAAKVS